VRVETHPTYNNSCKDRYRGLLKDTRKRNPDGAVKVGKAENIHKTTTPPPSTRPGLEDH
jgi:hypothetical protein